MGENYIHINDIVSFDRGDGRREMEISPLEILLYRDSHNSSDDRSTAFKIVPELLDLLDGLGAEGEA